jgi:hypothetical protein
MFEFKVDHLPEPMLEFRYGQKLVYPRDGLFLFGPLADVNPVHAVRYGVIGTEEGVRRFRRWAASVGGFIDIPPRTQRSRLVEPQHVPFPGFTPAFYAEWPSEPVCTVRDIDYMKLDQALRLENRHEAVRSAVDIYVDRLVSSFILAKDKIHVCTALMAMLQFSSALGIVLLKFPI